MFLSIIQEIDRRLQDSNERNYSFYFQDFYIFIEDEIAFVYNENESLKYRYEFTK